MTMKDTVLAFVDRINNHDVDGIVGFLAAPASTETLAALERSPS